MNESVSWGGGGAVGHYRDIVRGIHQMTGTRPMLAAVRLSFFCRYIRTAVKPKPIHFDKAPSTLNPKDLMEP